MRGFIHLKFRNFSNLNFRDYPDQCYNFVNEEIEIREFRWFSQSHT